MNLLFDLKYAWRLLLRTPGHSLLCVIVVALSVGLTMWSYSLAYAMRFKPLPFPGTERWYSVQLAANATATPRASVDAYTYQELLARTRNVTHLGAFGIESVVLSEGQASTSLRAGVLSPRLLAAMQVPPQMGRTFNESDGRPGAAPVVMLSHDTWQNYFAGDPAIVGKRVRIDAQPMQVVGVMPQSFLVFDDSAMWLPLKLEQLARPGDSAMTLSPFVYLERHQTLDTLLAQMKPVVEDVNRRHPALFDAGRHVALMPAHLMTTHQNLQIVATVVLLALLVLLLGGVNISMVFLARLLERSRELALRTALGATRTRLLRQCLLETAYVVALGLVTGYGLATLGVRWMQSVDAFGASIMATGRSVNLPTLEPIDFIAAIVAAALVWLLSTLIPAWRVSRQDASVVLAGSGKGVAGSANAKSAALLVGLQVTISSIVLVICVNLVLALRAENAKPYGIRSAGVMITTYPTVFRTRHSAASERLRYWEELNAAVDARMPGVKLAYATSVPTRPATVPAAIEGAEGRAKQGPLTVPLVGVSESYFELLGLQLKSGRLFDGTDSSGSLNVAVVDENIVKRHWPGQNAIGKRIRVDAANNGPWLTVVGVVSNVTRPYRREVGVVYRPLRQAAPESFHLLAGPVRVAAESRTALREAAFTVDRELPLQNLQMLDDYLAAANLNTSAMIPAFSVITAITLILAAAGLFGLISRSVARRTQEVGVRRALGGTQWQVTAVFLRQGAWYLTIAVGGGCLGILVASLLTRSIPNILNRAVPATLGVFVLMAIVIFAASYLPTRRAVALEPGDALRYE
jgi:predicted permease